MKSPVSIIEHFSVIPDPRIDRHKKHKLIDIIVLSICGVISSCNTFVDIEEYGKAKLDWFKKFLELPNGIPSHDTIGRVFSLLDPLELQKAFYEWVQSLVNLKDGEIINIDGKYINASHGASKNKRSIFGMVNAWASDAGVALGQLRIDFEKRDEKQGFRDLIDVLNLKGCTVTMDAGGSHADITNKIIEKGGNFVVALKNNQKSLKKQAEEIFNNKNIENFSISETLDKQHGRIEKRTCIVSKLSPLFLKFLEKKNQRKYQVSWIGLKTIVKIISNRKVKNEGEKTEVRYYLSSLEEDASKLLNVIRSHWGVENKLHWVLDTAFREDSCRVRNGYAGENFAVIRRLAVNLLKQELTSKRSINGKRLKCSWINEYLYKVISGMTPDNFAS